MGEAIAEPNSQPYPNNPPSFSMPPTLFLLFFLPFLLLFFLFIREKKEMVVKRNLLQASGVFRLVRGARVREGF